MGLSNLFRKKDKQVAASKAGNAPTAGRDVETAKVSDALALEATAPSSPSPAFQSPKLPPATVTSLNSPSLLSPAPVQRPLCRLGVVIDPCFDTTARPFSLPATSTTFDLILSPDAPLEALYAGIRDRLRATSGEGEGLPAGWSIGCYKVNIPRQAVYQAKEYTERYQLPVHLISHFPAYNLLDESQRAASMAVSTNTTPGRRSYEWESSEEDHEANRGRRSVSILDWFPDVALETSSEHFTATTSTHISILVRLGRTGPDGASPMTLLAHFAKPAPPPNPRSLRSPASSSSSFPSPSSTPRSPALSSFNGGAPYPPVAFECPRDASISELKELALQADNRPVGALNKLTMWRVDMTWREMLDCEAFGGLTTGDMPWPYPPNCPQPVSMSDAAGSKGGNVSVATIFPGHLSNANLVSLFVWIHPSATGILARRHQNVAASSSIGDANATIPAFRFPMIFSSPNTTPKASSMNNIAATAHSIQQSPRLGSAPSFTRTHSQRIIGASHDLASSTILPAVTDRERIHASSSSSSSSAGGLLPADLRPVSLPGRQRTRGRRPCTAPSFMSPWDPNQSPIIPSTPRFGASTRRASPPPPSFEEEIMNTGAGSKPLLPFGSRSQSHSHTRSTSISSSSSRSRSASRRPATSNHQSSSHYPLSPLALESFVATSGSSPPTSEGVLYPTTSSADSSLGFGLGLGIGLGIGGGGGDSSSSSSSSTPSLSSRDSTSSVSSSSSATSLVSTDAASVMLSSMDPKGSLDALLHQPARRRLVIV